MPLAVSIGLHVALAVVVGTIAMTLTGRRWAGDALAVTIILAPPAAPVPTPQPAPAPPPVEPAEPPPPAAPEPPPPDVSIFNQPVPPPTPAAERGESPAPAPAPAAPVPSAAIGDQPQDAGAIGATFAGLGTRRASSVVYVVDASGAMVGSMQFVMAELKRSVNTLAPEQRFQVVLYRNRSGLDDARRTGLYEVFHGSPRDDDEPVLLNATPQNKAELARWLDTIRPGGRSNPIDGVRCAIAMRPDAIFLLSRSIRRSVGESSRPWLEGSAPAAASVWGRPVEETLAELNELNPRSVLAGRRAVTIKTVQFLEDDPTGTMQAIADSHGDGPGSYRILKLEELQGR